MGMRMIFGLVRWIRHFFTKRRASVTVLRPDHYDPAMTNDLPPDFIPIETLISGQDIDGTGKWIGQDARVGQMQSGEMVTCERVRGVRCGCNHFVYDVRPKITETGTYPGIGGVCHYCSLEAHDLANRNVIPTGQAEIMSLYCSDCASHCDGCGRRNLCIRHTRPFEDADGRQQQLCPECLKQARSKRMFKQTVAIVARLVAEDNPPSPSRSRGAYHDG